MLQYLEHYGVKGMKWGIRRTPEQLGHRENRARPYRSTPKQLVEKGAITKQQLASEVLDRKVTKSQVIPRHKDSGETNLRKGSKVQHITGIDMKDIRPGQLYVTANQKDNDMYTSFLASRLLSKGFSPSKAVIDLKVDLKAPSSKDQYKIFQAFLKENEAQVRKDISTWLKEKGKDPVVKQQPKDLYDQFINSVEKSSKSQQEFYKTLRKKGYNAVLDEHDITGSWMQAQKPLIIMDTSATLGNMKVSQLDVTDMRNALERLING